MLCLYLFLKSDGILELKPSNKEKEYFKTLDLLSYLREPETSADIKEMLNIATPEILTDFFILKNLNLNLIKEVLESGEPYLISHLEIDGNTLKQMGYKGEQIGEILEGLRKTVIKHPKKNNKKDLLKEIP